MKEFVTLFAGAWWIFYILFGMTFVFMPFLGLYYLRKITVRLRHIRELLSEVHRLERKN